MTKTFSDRYLDAAARYVSMWSVHGPGLGDRLYRHFSGHRAESRARKFAAGLGPGHRVDEGMGSHRGWVSLEVWQEILAALTTRAAGAAGETCGAGQ